MEVTVLKAQNPGGFHPSTHLRAINKRAGTVLQRAELWQIPAAPAGGLIGLIVTSAVGVVSGWWNDRPNPETWIASTRLLVAFLCSGLVGWLVASGSRHLAEALIAMTLALALFLGLIG
jgi:hypothetical protein